MTWEGGRILALVNVLLPELPQVISTISPPEMSLRSNSIHIMALPAPYTLPVVSAVPLQITNRNNTIYVPHILGTSTSAVFDAGDIPSMPTSVVEHTTTLQKEKGGLYEDNLPDPLHRSQLNLAGLDIDGCEDLKDYGILQDSPTAMYPNQTTPPPIGMMENLPPNDGSTYDAHSPYSSLRPAGPPYTPMHPVARTPDQFNSEKQAPAPIHGNALSAAASSFPFRSTAPTYQFQSQQYNPASAYSSLAYTLRSTVTASINNEAPGDAAWAGASSQHANNASSVPPYPVNAPTTGRMTFYGPYTEITHNNHTKNYPGSGMASKNVVQTMFQGKFGDSREPPTPKTRSPTEGDLFKAGTRAARKRQSRHTSKRI